MKHIFGIQSHLTFYVAHKIIQLNQFNPDDCLFISGRNYKIPDKYNSIYKHIYSLHYGGGKIGRFFSGINIVKTQKNISQFDRIIDDFTGSDCYDCYISYCGDDVANLVVTKKNCVAYYLTEEGIGVYSDKNPKIFSGWRYLIYRVVLKPLFPRLYAIKENYQYTKYYKFKGFYAISSQAYPLFQSYPITIIGNPFETIDIGFSPDVLLSIDPFFWNLSINTVDKIYYHLSKYIKGKNYHTITYKYHPMFGVYPDIKKEYEKIIHQYFGNNIIQLDDTVVLENIMMTYKCDFYSNGSSVQIYGTIAGAKCYDFSSFIRSDIDDVSDIPFEDCVKEVQFLP